MIEDKKTKSESRHGKHADEAFRVSFYLSAREKAIAVLTAELNDSALTDVMKSGLMNEAIRAGIVRNGQVTEEYKDRITAYAAILEQDKKQKRRTPHEQN